MKRIGRASGSGGGKQLNFKRGSSKAWRAEWDHYPELSEEAEAAGWKLTLTRDARYAILVTHLLGNGKHKRVHGYTGERIHGYTGGRTNGRSERGRVNGFTDARVDGRMHDRAIWSRLILSWAYGNECDYIERWRWT